MDSADMGGPVCCAHSVFPLTTSHTHLHACIHAHTQHTHTHTHTHNTHTRTHTTRTHTHTHTHTHTQKSGGRLGSFSPCIEQVQRTCDKLRESGFVGEYTNPPTTSLHRHGNCMHMCIQSQSRDIVDGVELTHPYLESPAQNDPVPIAFVITRRPPA